MKTFLPFFKKAFSSLLTLALIVGASYIVYAYVDDPNVDSVPQYLRDSYVPKIYDAMPPVTIDDYDNFNIGTDFAEVHMTVNPRNPTQFFNAYNINGTHHTENGFDWATNNPVFPNQAGDPVAAYDSLGRLYYDNMKSPITGTWVAYSDNNGASWIAANVSANIGNDKNWISADQSNGPYSNYVYGAMTPGNFVRSTNRGSSFAQTFNSSNTLPGAMTAVGANINTGVSGGAVYFVSNTGSTFTPTYNFHLSTNGGANFTTVSAGNRWVDTVGVASGGRHSISNMRTRPYPMIGADNGWSAFRGRVYVIHAGNPGTSNKPEIWCRYSTNMGSNWSARIRVTDGPMNVSNHWHPAMWVDQKTGHIFAQWMDTRDTPTNDSALIYASRSTDGGVTWAPNVQVSNKKFRINCTSCGGGGTPLYLGDYNSIVSNGKVSMLSWTDFRNNSFGSYTAYFPDFGMRVTPATDSLNPNVGNITINVQVPSVKLYSDTVEFSAVVTPTPGAGTINVTFPSGNKLTSFPSAVPMRIQGSGGVTAGTYTVTVTGKGPNGTPIHKRDVTVYVANTVTGVEDPSQIPTRWELAQNYPNPFNPVTRINYSTLAITDVKISVFNSVGKEVAVYKFKQKTAGNHFVIFNAGALPSGVYFYKLETAQFTDTKKMLLIK